MKNQDKIVLDYAGALVNNLFRVNISTGGGEKLYQYSWWKDAWVNQLLKANVCFFHANGNVKERIQDLADQRSLSPSIAAGVSVILALCFS